MMSNFLYHCQKTTRARIDVLKVIGSGLSVVSAFEVVNDSYDICFDAG